MNSKERVLAAINKEKPDRIPVDLGTTNCTSIHVNAYQNLADYMNIKNININFIQKNFQVVDVDERVLANLGIDTRTIHGQPPDNSKEKIIDDRTYINEWGIKLHKPENGLYYDMIEHPLADASIEDLANYEIPDPYDRGRVKGLKERAKELYKKGEYALVGDTVDTGFFEPSWFIRGFEQFMMDLVSNKEFASTLMEMILDYQIKRYEVFLDEVGEYLDIVFVGDDLAMKDNTIISPQTYREMIKPLQRRYFKTLKQMTDAKLLYHSCGNITPFIEDLIEIGVDILNPVQVSAENMNTAELKNNYGDRLVFWGGIDTTEVLPEGDPADVKREVKKRVSDLGPEGYVVAAVHDIQHDVPPENIVSMFKTATDITLE